jgi:hypothetical protein
MQHGAARPVNGPHHAFVHGDDVGIMGGFIFNVVSHKACPSSSYAKNTHPFVNGPANDGLDARIQARDVTASCKNPNGSDFFISFHGSYLHDSAEKPCVQTREKAFLRGLISETQG